MGEQIREHIYLAALLHDIGKFYQRADSSLNEKFKEKEFENAKKIADYICPLNEHGNFGYQHSVWTFKFIEEIEQYLKKIPTLDANIFDNTKEQDSLFQLAAYHHKPSSKFQAFITLADWWSAGIDRRAASELENDEPNNSPKLKWGKGRYKTIPLYSIFNQINNGDYNRAFGLNPLNLDEKTFFPKNITKIEDGVDEKKYNALWKAFKDELKDLPTDSFDGFADSLLYLLKKYTWCIPSNTTDMANVSLFDHLKTTAAFADCFYRYELENPDSFTWDGKSLTLKDASLPVMLVGGDISGIQKFIYNITSSKAALSLKGRSFYLQLMIDSIIQRICSHSDIKVNQANIVYSSGGKFYMLLPNTTKVQNALAELQKEFESSVFDEHNGQLIFNLDTVAFAYKSKEIIFEDKTTGNIGELWKRLADKLTTKKNKKFENHLKENFDSLFNPISNNGDKVCAITGIESDNLVKISKGDTEVFVLPVVKKQIDLGTTLKDADYIFTYKGIGVHDYLSKSKRSKCDVGIFDTYNYLFDQEQLTIDDAEFRKISSVDVSTVKRINNINFLDAQIKGKAVSYGFQFYGGNQQALTPKGENKTFEELTWIRDPKDKTETPTTYLGVLRMDVDNLGKIFINGLADRNKSFSAYSTLSFMLDYFFSGYLNTIRDKYKDYVNILYSGGDDVFAIGRWDQLILFARDIRTDFARFVGRDDISISGGITLVGNKFPLDKAAEMAGEAEHAAKDFNNGEKNAFNLFSESISWKEEFKFVEEWKQRFVVECEYNNLSRALLHKLMTFANIVKNNETLENGKQADYSYIWNTAYYLKRFENEKSEPIKQLCKDIKELLLLKTGKEQSRNYILLSVAARWTELELRIIDK